MPVPKQANAKKPAVKKSEAKATTPTKKEGVLCGCGCGEMTAPGRKFLQGHDARFKGRVAKVADGRLNWDDIKGDINEYAVKAYKDAIAEAKKHVVPKATKKKAATASKSEVKPKLKVKAKAKPKSETVSHSNDSENGGDE